MQRNTLKVSELNDWLSDLPQIIKHKDGDKVRYYQLTFYFCKSSNRSDKWIASYTCEGEIYLISECGPTLTSAASQLKQSLDLYYKYK